MQDNIAFFWLIVSPLAYVTSKMVSLAYQWFLMRNVYKQLQYN